MKNNNGISMIVLVITIIVLLILSTVVVTSVFKENGIIINTEKAKQLYELAQEKEKIKSATIVAMAKGKKGVIYEENLKDALMSEFENENVFDDEEEKVFLLEFVDNKRYYKLTYSGTLSETDKTAIVRDETPARFDGTGTESNPYIIMSIEDLVYLSKTVNEGNNYLYKYFKLGRNLDFNNKISYCNYNTKEYNEYLGITDDVGLKEVLTNRKYNGFIPIGNGDKIEEKNTYYHFAGNFDGKNYSIKNMYEKVENYGGLFGCSTSKIINLNVTGEINSIGNQIGGIVGENKGYILNCIAGVDIKATGSEVGGIAGRINGNKFAMIENCENHGNISGTANIVGGIVGRYGSIVKSKNYGKVNGNNVVGGIIGQMQSVISESENYGEVIANESVGGIGDNFGSSAQNMKLHNSFNNATVSGKKYVGGIVGMGYSYKELSNCYNLGKVIGESNIGGIIGECEFTQNPESKIINSYSKGEIIGNASIGGIIGEKYGYGIHYIENSYYLKQKDLPIYNLGKYSVGDVSIYNSRELSKKYIEGKETSDKSFLELLNEFVDNYNTEKASESDFVALERWKLDSENGHPIFEYQ